MLKKAITIVSCTLIGVMLTVVTYFLADHTTAPVYGSTELFKVLMACVILAIVGLIARADFALANKKGLVLTLMISAVEGMAIAICNASVDKKFLFTSSGALVCVICMAVCCCISAALGMIKVDE